MAEQFYSILTSIGKAKIANANALGNKLNLTTLVLGDGNGKYYNPTENQEVLVNEVWKGNISSITIDSKNPNWIVIETIIAGNVGGFFIREVGISDDEGSLIAIGKYPETYKPVISDGSTKDLIIRMILEVSNSANVTLKIDPAIIMATKKDIEVLDNKIKNIKVPVTKVNNKLGDVTLKAEDIKANNDKTIEENLEEVTSQMIDITKQVESIEETNIADITNNINEIKVKTDRFNTTSTNPTKTSRVNCEGYFYATRVFNMTYADYAENFSVVEKCEAGDIISIDPNTGRYIKSKNESSPYVIGVVSDEYAFCIGGTGKDTDTPIGMKGTLNVKVTGKGNIGDLIVSSKIEGVAKATNPSCYVAGTVIGKCLEHFDFKDSIGKTRILIMNC